MNKKIISLLIVAAVFGSAGFFGGMKYVQSKSPQGFGNMTSEQRQQRIQEFGANIDGTRNGRNNFGGLISGEIISKDADSMTIKIQSGGSKIVLMDQSTEILKFTDGTSDDLAVGKSVMVTGTSNQDGSITAQNIQLRPVVSPIPSQSK